MRALNFVNPIAPMADAFLDIWNALPDPLRDLFSVSLLLAVIYAWYRILSS